MQKDFKASRPINHALWLYVRYKCDSLGHYSLIFSNMIRSEFKCSTCVMVLCERLFINHSLGRLSMCSFRGLFAENNHSFARCKCRELCQSRIKHMLSIFNQNKEKSFNFASARFTLQVALKIFIPCNKRATEIVSEKERTSQKGIFIKTSVQVKCLRDVFDVYWNIFLLVSEPKSLLPDS